MLKKFIFALAGFCLLAGTAFAENPSKGCPPYPDGRKTDTSPLFDAIDTNHDGKLTHDEWQASGSPEGSWKFFMAKKESIGKDYISRKVFLAEPVPDGMDANCDGKVTLDEAHAMAKKVAQQSGGAAQPKGGPAPKPPAK